MYQSSGNQNALVDLSARVRADLETLRYPEDPWLTSSRQRGGKASYDVVIVGGGQGALAVAAGLRRERVDNIIAFDRQPAGREGPWVNTARMRTLRTKKHLPGIDPTIPNLAPQAWFTAKYGSQAWHDLGKISKEDWLEYLVWCRKTLDLPVRNLVDVTSITPHDDVFRVDINVRDIDGAVIESDFVFARRVVLASGIDGGGAWYMPNFIQASLPQERYALASEHIDFSRLAGKRIAVLGAGASAFDNASTALESGAREATVCIRRTDIQRVNPQIWMGKAGFLRHYADLDDEMKWRFMHHFFNLNLPAPQDAYNRLSGLPGASIRQNAAWKDVALVNDSGFEEIEILTESGDTFRADFLIVAIGFINNLALRPELSKIAAHIALWEDRYAPPSGEGNPQIASHPYLDRHFAFVEKTPGEAPYLGRVYNFTYSALVSMGLSGSAISGFKYAVPRLVQGLTQSLFLEDADKIYKEYKSYAEPEMTGLVPFRNPAAPERK